MLSQAETALNHAINEKDEAEMKLFQLLACAVAALVAITLVGCAEAKNSESGDSSTPSAIESSAKKTEGITTFSSNSEKKPKIEIDSNAESQMAEQPSDFVLLDSSERIYSTFELEALSNDELFYARNELFARHGVRFEDPNLNSYFEAKRWYRQIEPKTDEYGTNILNLVESMNASTIKRIELERNSAHVNALSPNRIDMYKAYRSIAEQYEKAYGEYAFESHSKHKGLTGVFLIQLVDFEGDGWEELLIAYFDKAMNPENDSLNPGAYRIEVWSYDNGTANQIKQVNALSTQASSSYMMLKRAGKTYEFMESGDYDSTFYFYYYYDLSQSKNPTAGNRYWYNESDISFDFDQIKTITNETLKTLDSDYHARTA